MDCSLPNTGKNAGALLLLGGAVWILAIIISEALYPGYSINSNYISDLGTGPWPAGIIFNLSTIIFGICVISGASILVQSGSKEFFIYGLAIAGFGVMFVGVFPEDTGLPHFVSAGTAFIIGSISAIAASMQIERPFSFFSATMGVTGLAALTALKTGFYLSLGPGGMERLIAYPLVLWIITYGSYMMNQRKEDGQCQQI